MACGKPQDDPVGIKQQACSGFVHTHQIATSLDEALLRSLARIRSILAFPLKPPTGAPRT
jgi:hypothetical protein